VSKNENRKKIGVFIFLKLKNLFHYWRRWYKFFQQLKLSLKVTRSPLLSMCI